MDDKSISRAASVFLGNSRHVTGEHAIRKDERSLLGIETKWGVSFRAFKITAGRILEPGIATRGR